MLSPSPVVVAAPHVHASISPVAQLGQEDLKAMERERVLLLFSCFPPLSQMWSPSCLLNVSQMWWFPSCVQGFSIRCLVVFQLSSGCGLQLSPRCLPDVVFQLPPRFLHSLSSCLPIFFQMWFSICLLDVSQMWFPRCCLPVASKVS